MSDSAATASPDRQVPDQGIPAGQLPPLRSRELPAPIPLRKMLGPSIILAGLALGSGEFILWPYITYKSGFVFFWACLLGVTTQYFMNMEITRWTLATGESAITGFCRLSRHWAWVFLVANVVPWIIPAWSVGSSQLISWLVWGTPEAGQQASPFVTELAIASLFFCGIVLTAGPVVYETVEKVQVGLVGSVIVMVIVLACLMVRPDALTAMASSIGQVGQLPSNQLLSTDMLLGAIAFAGVGGTLNLGQSNYVKEKGYGMGRYIGRITSPLTGKEEAVSELGYQFPPTSENLERWHTWWRRACIEHFFSFFMTCLVCLALLALISYSIFYRPDGQLVAGAEHYGNDMKFILGEASAVAERLGGGFRVLFLLMGVAILFTTEIGVLDGASRISTDLVKVNWLAKSRFWTESRLYLLFLWGTILAGSALLLGLGATEVEKGGANTQGLALFKYTAALNGGVMFLYCGLLLYLNYFKLPPTIRMKKWRAAILAWGVLFFGFFGGYALASKLGWL